MSRLRALAGTAAALVAVAALPATEAHAAGKIVLCSQTALRTAITQANTTPGPAVLLLAPNCTYTLTAPDNPGNGLPVITSEISIVGSLLGSQNVIRRQSATAFRIFEVSGPNGRLTLNNLTVRDGVSASAGSGGGLLARAGTSLTLNGVEVTRNVADSTGEGGGIANFGTLTLRNSTVSYNIATGGAGGIHSAGTANISNSTITGNTCRNEGGGISASGSLTLTNSRLTDNAARDWGGGLLAGALTGTITDTLVRGNTAHANGAPDGGGIRAVGATTLTLERTTVFANRGLGGGGGGGIANDANATLILRNSSVTNNYDTSAPGGLLNAGTVSLTATPIVDNVPTNCSPSVVAGCTN
uniref:Right-handed parallel beta-helix repeat-containing protein n=1 Tax=Streptomyces sp. NBC_00049 TaxID=2903617 RepID=A0AAU2JQ44_9ACTN